MKRVLAIFPHFEQCEPVERVRRQFDPLFRQLSHHITLVAPFESDLANESLHAHIEAATRHTAPFALRLQSITGH